MRTRLVFAGLFVLLGLAAIIGSIASSTSAASYIKSHYRHVGADQGAQIYLSPKSITQTVQDISNADSPGDRRTTESGVFLRYPNSMVAVLVNRGGGSKVEIADQRTGYTHFYGYIGGFWGSYTGPAGAFRGGGPGTGK